MSELSESPTTEQVFPNIARKIGGSDVQLADGVAVAISNSDERQLTPIVRVFGTNPFCLWITGQFAVTWAQFGSDWQYDVVPVIHPGVWEAAES
jgi:hypothetical protein